jgi:hypothetical protein
MENSTGTVKDETQNGLWKAKRHDILAKRINRAVEKFWDMTDGRTIDVEFSLRLKDKIKYHNENVEHLKAKNVDLLRRHIDQEVERLSSIREKLLKKVYGK